MTPGPTINDLTFQAATVNGSGSQSANLVLTRAIFSMGIPVAPKNVFPSNIELATSRITNDRLRKQLTNMLYVGVVAGLLDVPFEAIEHGIRRTFQTKPKAWQVNVDAACAGYEFYRENFLYLSRCGMTESVPSRRILSAS